jgi:endonuclease/exonuclease/phosphatase family metal-dependent hydrolase
MDGKNRWIHRKNHVFDIIKYHQPKILGMQEVLPDQLDDLKNALPDYSVLGVGRDDGKTKGEFSPIFFRGLLVERWGTFWYRDDPTSPGNPWNSKIPRICTWAHFKDPETKLPFAIYNTHWSLNLRDQIQSASIIWDHYQKQSVNRPTIIMGDFNTWKGTPGFKWMEKHFRNAYFEIPSNIKSREISLHWFAGKKTKHWWRLQDRLIDFFWLTRGITVKQCQIIQETPPNIVLLEGVYPSDHYPVRLDCEIANNFE